VTLPRLSVRRPTAVEIYGTSNKPSWARIVLFPSNRPLIQLFTEPFFLVPGNSLVLRLHLSDACSTSSRLTPMVDPSTWCRSGVCRKRKKWPANYPAWSRESISSISSGSRMPSSLSQGRKKSGHAEQRMPLSYVVGRKVKTELRRMGDFAMSALASSEKKKPDIPGADEMPYAANWEAQFGES
jgi:hypothetical protein